MWLGLFISAAPAWVCMNVSGMTWLERWIVHDGQLPNDDAADYPSSQTWFVSADFGEDDGQRIVKGEVRCHDSNIGPGPSSHNPNGNFCWCRMTSPKLGRWVYLYNHGSVHCSQGGCSNLCGHCVRVGTYLTCTRHTVLN